jgi:alcohol dehydrogenase
MPEALAAVLRTAGSPGDAPPFDALRVEPVSVRPPGPGEVAVRPVAACLCHSDLSVLSGHRIRPLPMVLGHEASGVVTEVGTGVRRVAPGDHVVMTFVPECGTCRYCREGRPALCTPGNAANARGELLGGGRPFRDAAGAPLHQHLGLSAFSEHTVVAEQSLIRLPDGTSLETAALFGCAVVTGVGAVVRTAAVPPGSTAAVFGLGGVGLSAVMGCRLVGCSRIVALDLDPAKLVLARELGATDALIAGAEAAAAVHDLTGGGVDFAFDATGVPSVLTQAYASTRRGGTAVVVGLSDPAAEVAIKPSDLVASERCLRGSYMGTIAPARDIPWLLDLHRAGRLPVERLIGERLALADLPAAFERLHRGTLGRQVVRIGAEAA